MTASRPAAGPARPPSTVRETETKARRAVAAFGARVRQAADDTLIHASALAAHPAEGRATLRLSGPGFCYIRDRVRRLLEGMDGVTAVTGGGPNSLVLDIAVDYAAPVSRAATAPPTPAMADEIRAAARPDGPPGTLGKITGAHHATLRGLAARGLVAIEDSAPGPFHPGDRPEPVGVLTAAGWAKAVELDPALFGELATTTLADVHRASSTRGVPAGQAALLRALEWIDGYGDHVQLTEAGFKAFIAAQARTSQEDDR